MAAVVLFDGVCNFCNATVNFILSRDSEGFFRFAALQSEAARPLLAEARLPSSFLDNIVLVEDGVCYVRSTAALRILRRLSWPWPLLYAAVIVPRPIRDGVYDWVARNRYRWFGKSEVCRLPTPSERARFL